MADEAFALSPISARAAEPREEDYDAISAAFMETSRGRWFLGEYAKRNRNADTSMVLDAVARIEQSLAAQKQPAPEPDNKLADALTAIRATVDQARSVASEALEGPDLEERLAPVRKGARIIHEIAWRWREIGADVRICDLIDSQVGAIEAACGHISSVDPHKALGNAFDLIEQRLGGLDGGDLEASPETEADRASPASPSTAPPSPPPAETAHSGDIEAELEDDAVLDMVAFEMGAPDPSEGEAFADPDESEWARTPEMEVTIAETDVAALPAEIDLAEIAPAEPLTVAAYASAHEMNAGRRDDAAIHAAGPSVLQSTVERSIELSIEPSLETSSQPSLGSTVIASGLVRKPPASTSDPLAPIRRLSQAEKIALFS